jgi:diguanylate cyclase (GGDEF)-like protein
MGQPPASASRWAAMLAALGGLWLVARLPWPESAVAAAAVSVFLIWRGLHLRSQFARTLRAHTHRDQLTGLPDRLALRVNIAAAARMAPDRVALLVLDLDGFRQLNEMRGHRAGDQVLVAVAERLERVLGPPGAGAAARRLYRLGGDEFAILLEGVPGLEAAVEAAERALSALSEPIQLGPHGRQVQVNVSVGIALGAGSSGTRAAPLDPDELVRDADVAMSAAKSAPRALGAGGSAYEVFEPRMHQLLLERASLEADLGTAVERGELLLHYQPVVHLATRSVVGMEVLVRWRHPVHGLVPPGRFIPIAEETGQIVEIGAWVLEQACAQASEWLSAYPRALSQPEIGVNLSARQLERPDLVDQVAGVLARTGLAPRALLLEITESILVEHDEEIVTRLHALKELGVRLAVDDFGTGFSSLAYLRRFPVDTLKIDRAFVQGVGGGPEDEALAHAIVRLGEALGLQTLAEGIETVEQADGLVGLGCTFGQGFWFARPMEAEALGLLLAAGGTLHLPIGMGEQSSPLAPSAPDPARR